jgi:hypothetical protein
MIATNVWYHRIYAASFLDKLHNAHLKVFSRNKLSFFFTSHTYAIRLRWYTHLASTHSGLQVCRVLRRAYVVSSRNCSSFGEQYGGICTGDASL